MRGLGRMLASTGAVAEGEAQLRRAIGIADELLPTEPSNMIWVQSAAGAKLDHGRILLLMGDNGEAAAAILGGCKLSERLGNRPRSTPEQRELAFNCAMRRVELGIATQSGEAISVARQAVVIAGRIDGPDAARNRLQVAIANKLVGDALAAAGNRQSATVAWQRALGLWPADNWGPRSRRMKKDILESLGRAAEARVIDHQLKTIGYRKLI
jgi:hypothetical protein